ncbi:MAG TPA: myxococcus cysteine-rich repeat containing protein, partial [Kofleriaceae bacterium]
ASIHARWKIGDAITELELAPGDPAWTGAITPQPQGTIVQYSIAITLDDGTVITRPDNPGDPMYQAFIGTATQLACEAFDSDPKWTRTGSNPAEWQFAKPSSTAVDDPLEPHSGAYIYGTNLIGPGAYGAGEDVTLAMPSVDTKAGTNIHLQYWRWLTVDQTDRATISGNAGPIWRNDQTLPFADKEWRFHDVDLTRNLDDQGQIVVDWNLTTDGTIERGGWNLDDVCIVGFTKTPRCGDAVVDSGEQCDDGNTMSGDGCSDVCVFELEASGVGCCSASGDPVGISAAALVLLRALRRRDRARRGSRSTRAGRVDRSPPRA